MAYVDPKKVLSPKGVIRGVRVLHDTGPGEDSWAVAEVQWGDSEAVGIRWNGDEGEGVGNPQSRGHPTWFIVPPQLEDVVRKAAERLARDGHQAIADGYRAMARDREREKEAADWTEGLIGDAGNSKG
jgi:hypothetical protein